MVKVGDLKDPSGTTASDFNRTAPLVLRYHHLFWAVPLLIAAWLLRRTRWPFAWCLGLAIGCVASDLLHHFLILPILVGNTGWHWP